MTAYLQEGKTSPNLCPGYNTKQSGVLENTKYPFIAIDHRFILARSGSTW